MRAMVDESMAIAFQCLMYSGCCRYQAGSCIKNPVNVMGVGFEFNRRVNKIVWADYSFHVGVYYRPSAYHDHLGYIQVFTG